MTDNYHIVGSLHMHGESSTVKFKLQPDSKYLSPCRDYAVFYHSWMKDTANVPDEGGSAPVARRLDNGTVSLAVPDETLRQALIQIAVKRQLVELHVVQDNEQLRVTGFKFPV